MNKHRDPDQLQGAAGPFIRKQSEAFTPGPLEVTHLEAMALLASTDRKLLSTSHNPWSKLTKKNEPFADF